MRLLHLRIGVAFEGQDIFDGVEMGGPDFGVANLGVEGGGNHGVVERLGRKEGRDEGGAFGEVGGEVEGRGGGIVEGSGGGDEVPGGWGVAGEFEGVVGVGGGHEGVEGLGGGGKVGLEQITFGGGWQEALHGRKREGRVSDFVFHFEIFFY